MQHTNDLLFPPQGQARAPSARVLASALEQLIQLGALPTDSLMDFHGQLCVWLNQAIQATKAMEGDLGFLRARKHRLNLDQPWDWFSLHKNEDCKAGLLTIHPYRPLPPHDHPDTSGLLVVLDGHIIEHSYCMGTDPEPGGTLELIHEQTNYLSPGQFTVFGARENRIHSLSTAGRPAQALSVQYHPDGETRHNWYLAESGSTTCVGVQRMTGESVCRIAC